MIHEDSSFAKDFPGAKEKENQLRDFLARVYGLKFLFKSKDHPDYDKKDFDDAFETRDGNIILTECKNDIYSGCSMNIAVESWSWGKPSGIVTTKAHCFIYIIRISNQNAVYSVSVKKLKQMIADEMYSTEMINCGDKGSGSRVYIFTLATVKKHFTYLGNLPN